MSIEYDDIAKELGLIEDEAPVVQEQPEPSQLQKQASDPLTQEIYAFINEASGREESYDTLSQELEAMEKSAGEAIFPDELKKFVISAEAGGWSKDEIQSYLEEKTDFFKEAGIVAKGLGLIAGK